MPPTKLNIPTLNRPNIVFNYAGYPTLLHPNFIQNKGNKHVGRLKIVCLTIAAILLRLLHQWNVLQHIN